MFKVFVVTVVLIGLAGCGLARQQEQRARLEAAFRQQKARIEVCQAMFSEEQKEAIARAKCFNDADQGFMPFSTAPDLLALRMAKRGELAERQAEGKITRAQAMLELTELNAQLGRGLIST